MRFISCQIARTALRVEPQVLDRLKARLADLALSHSRRHCGALCLAAEGVQLDRGVVHEWLGLATSNRSMWVPPVRILAHYARHAVRASTGAALWIGASCWPYPRALIGSAANGALFQRSLFVDIPDRAQRVWAIDLALRSAAVSCVVADGSGLTMSESRRLQLAAAAGGALVMLARPPWEARELSAAHTRWLVSTHPSADASPRWTLELLRRKGTRPTEDARWSVQYDHETGDVRVFPISVDRPVEAARPPEPARLTA